MHGADAMVLSLRGLTHVPHGNRTMTRISYGTAALLFAAGVVAPATAG